MDNPTSFGSFIPLRTPRRQASKRSGRSGLASELEHAALSSATPPYLITALYLILPNLPLLFSSRVFGGSTRGYISLEYLLIGALGVFLPRFVVMALLSFELLADFAYSVCNAYQFSVEELLFSLRYIFALPTSRLIEGFCVLGLGILLCAVLALLRPRGGQRLWTAGAMLVCTAVLIVFDIIGGESQIWHKDVARISYRAARTPIATLVFRQIKFNIAARKSHLGEDTPMNSASDHAISFLTNHKGSMESPNVVLIVVESWGIPLDEHLGSALTAPYDDPRVLLKYVVSRGTVPFTGHTVPGEARELCHSMIGFGILHPAPETVAHCLPAFFHARGYQNFAVHGFIGQNFSRSSWYPRLGFDRSWFGPELNRMGLPNCPGSFPGVCDGSIANWIGGELQSEQQDQPRFIYWVTLNSHLIEPEHPDLPDDGVCATELALRDSAALCSWFRLVRAVNQSVSLTALVPTERPTVFVIVGDHAPPFGDPQLRAEFSSSLVPYEMLTPKESRPH